MAGRIQVAAKGSQDQYFTDNPEYSYFLKTFKKHSNYAGFFKSFDFEEELFFGNVIRCKIPARYGDVLKNVSVKTTLGQGSYVESIGHAMIEYVDMYIGDILIQNIPGDYLQIHSENYITQTKQNALDKLIGKCPDELSGTAVHTSTILGHVGSVQEKKLLVDIPFYFYNNPEIALPLCALEYQEITIEIKLREKLKCTFTDTITEGGDGSIEDMKLICELLYLNEDERIKLKSTSLEYPITQIQTNKYIIPANTENFKTKIEFINPVKELFFIIQGNVGNFTSVFDYDHTRQSSVDARYINYEQLRNLELELDSDTILNDESGDVIYLRAVQSGIHHSRTQLFRRYYSYSFALEPERWYPTGQRNFSLVKEQFVKLHLNNDNAPKRDLKIYALSYNVLKIHKGEAQILFSHGKSSH